MGRIVQCADLVGWECHENSEECQHHIISRIVKVFYSKARGGVDALRSDVFQCVERLSLVGQRLEYGL